MEMGTKAEGCGAEKGEKQVLTVRAHMRAEGLTGRGVETTSWSRHLGNS